MVFAGIYKEYDSMQRLLDALKGIKFSNQILSYM